MMFPSRAKALIIIEQHEDIMETLALIWTAAPQLKVQLIVLAMTGQIVLTIWLYSKMSKARVAAVKAGTVKPEQYRAAGTDEPEDLAVYTRAVANQYELPVLFYAVIIAGLALRTSSWITVVLAILFVIVRTIHAREMVGENAVFRRRRLFIRSFQVFMLLLIELVISTFAVAAVWY